MKQIAITGGKGGTGKSTVATALAVLLGKEHKVLLVDADVDCPNDHLLLGIERKKIKTVFQRIPKWNFKKCIKCGTCAKHCPAKAITLKPFPIFERKKCIRCFCCIEICPQHALSLKN